MAVVSVEELVCVGGVSEFHIGCIPVELLACTDGDVAEQDGFS